MVMTVTSVCAYYCPSQESEFLKEVKVQEIIDVKQIVEVSKTSTMYVHMYPHCTFCMYVLGLCDNRNNIITIFHDIFTKLS